MFLAQIEFIRSSQMYLSAELTEKRDSVVSAVMVSGSETVVLRKTRVRAGRSEDVELLFRRDQNWPEPTRTDQDEQHKQSGRLKKGGRGYAMTAFLSWMHLWLRTLTDNAPAQQQSCSSSRNNQSVSSFYQCWCRTLLLQDRLPDFDGIAKTFLKTNPCHYLSSAAAIVTRQSANSLRKSVVTCWN